MITFFIELKIKFLTSETHDGQNKLEQIGYISVGFNVFERKTNPSFTNSKLQCKQRHTNKTVSEWSFLFLSFPLSLKESKDASI